MKSKWDRCRQILAWAKTEFPIPEDTEIRTAPRIFYEGDECQGLTGRDHEDGPMVIWLSERLNPMTHVAIDTLLHEMAHAELWDSGLGIQHGRKFHRHAGDIYDAWEHHGKSDSLQF